MFAALLASGGALAASAGKITVNDDRVFDISGEAEVSIDDHPATLPEMHDLIDDGHGWRSASVVLGADATLGSGSVTKIEFDNNLKGPVTSTAPLRVLGQPVTINGNTVLVRFSDPALLTLGQLLEVSGVVDTDSSIVASRAALDDSLAEWRVSGFLTQFDGGAGTATIGSPPGGQAIAFAGVTPTGCATGPALGEYVTAVATPIAGFVPGQTLDTVSVLRCDPLVPVGAVDDHDAFEGLVDVVLDPSTFTLGGITVTHDATTLFKAGNADDLAPGVRIEAEGTFTAPAVLAARRIRFILPSIRFRAPVDPAAVVVGQSITILGNSVLDNAQDRDEDLIMANGLADPTQVEVRAYLDLLGQLFATRVRSRGGPSDHHYNLQAPAETVSQPTLTALGLTVDTSSSTFTDENLVTITAGQFFAAMSVGTLFEIDDAVFDAPSKTLSGGVVRLSDDGSAANLSLPSLATAVPNASVSGTVSTIALDLVFSNGFE